MGGRGPETSENLRGSEFEIVTLKFRPIFRPKSGEEQTNKKRSSLKFRPISRPKSGEEQKKRSSLKLRPIFCPKSGDSEPKA